MIQLLRSPVDDLVTTIFPAECQCCEEPLLRASPVPVCEACVELLRPSRTFACWQCGEAMGLELDLEDARFARQMEAQMRCRECRMVPPDFDRAVSFGTYDGQLRSLIGLLKFDGVLGTARILGDKLAEAILQLESPEKTVPLDMLVIAVPLFSGRERQRGYNQSVKLADRALARLRRLRPEWKLRSSHGLLVRRRSTESQYVLSRKGRRRNLRGAFAMAGEVDGCNVLVIDDIMTSGATARECARVLKTAGAAHVFIATVARAQKVTFARMHEDPGNQVAAWN